MKNFGRAIKIYTGVVCAVIVFAACMAFPLQTHAFTENRNSFSMHVGFHIYETVSVYYADGVLLYRRAVGNHAMNYVKQLTDLEQEALFEKVDSIDFSKEKTEDPWSIAQSSGIDVEIDYNNQYLHFTYGLEPDSVYDNLVAYMLEIAPADFVEDRKPLSKQHCFGTVC